MGRMNYRQRCKYKKYRSQLWSAIQRETIKKVRKLLRFVKADDDMIHSAIAIGVCPEIVELLQQSTGMSVEERAICRMTQALEADDTEQVQQFLDAGMSPDIALDSYENRPLHRARSAGMVRILLAAGADVNGLTRFGESPVFFARGEVLEELLTAGADATIIGKYGQSALMNYHPVEEIRLLMAAGANPRAVAVGGHTALHSVVDAEMLLAAGAHVNAEDERGRTPLDWALAHPYQHRIQKQLIAALIRAGGKRGSGKTDNA